MNEWVVRRMNGWMDVRTEGGMTQWMNGWTEE